MVSKIKNFKELSKNNVFRQKILLALEEGFKKIDTQTIFEENFIFKNNKLRIKKLCFNLEKYRGVYVVALGKNALQSGLTIKNILGGKLKGGIIFSTLKEKVIIGGNNKKFSESLLTFVWGSHPFPNKSNFYGALKLKDFISSLKEKDFVIFVISGGGSTLLSLHPQGISFLNKEKKILSELFRKGASIYEINVVRKHISILRGGGLAYFVYPAKGISLIFSDVPGDDLQIISSGPTIMDSTTSDDAWKIIKYYKLHHILERKYLLETVKDKKYFHNIQNILFLNNEVFLKAAARKLNILKIKTFIRSTSLKGNVQNVAKFLWGETLKMKNNTAFLYGGETTVNVKGKGKGGRNQELALNFLNYMQKGKTISKDDLIFVSLASDGVDNTIFAGALVDKLTLQKSNELGLNIEKFLKQNNSFAFFSKIGDYIFTGPTGSNVSDIILILKGKRSK